MSNPEYPNDKLYPWEIEILKMIAKGQDQTNFAKSQYYSPSTIHGLICRARKRMGVHTTAQLVVKAIALGYIEAKYE